MVLLFDLFGSSSGSGSLRCEVLLGGCHRGPKAKVQQVETRAPLHWSGQDHRITSICRSWQRQGCPTWRRTRWTPTRKPAACGCTIVCCTRQRRHPARRRRCVRQRRSLRWRCRRAAGFRGYMWCGRRRRQCRRRGQRCRQRRQRRRGHRGHRCRGGHHSRHRRQRHSWTCAPTSPARAPPSPAPKPPRHTVKSSGSRCARLHTGRCGTKEMMQALSLLPACHLFFGPAAARSYPRCN